MKYSSKKNLLKRYEKQSFVGSLCLFIFVNQLSHVPPEIRTIVLHTEFYHQGPSLLSDTGVCS